MSERGDSDTGTETEIDGENKDDVSTSPESATSDSTTVVRRERGLSRRGWTMVVSLVLVVVLVVLGLLVRVPYVALGPGPTYDTLSSVGNTPVVSVNGHQTYPTSGQLRMVTVSLTDDITLFGALGLWMSGQYGLAPREDYYSPGESEQQVQQQDVQQFKDSQTDAEVSALRYLHYPIDVVAQEIVDGSPADKVIRPGDRLLVVNGKHVASSEDVFNALTGTKPGQVVDIVVQTGDQPARDLKIKLTSHPDRKQGFLGLTAASHADVPFKVNISLNDVGGPSAGLMFALAIIDKMTPDNVNGGMSVAGTGQIDDIGDVLPIGGIPFKLVAARAAGATIFLTPADNCAEAKAHVPAGLRLVKVTSLGSAVSELADLRAGRPVPGC